MYMGKQPQSNHNMCIVCQEKAAFIFLITLASNSKLTIIYTYTRFKTPEQPSSYTKPAAGSQINATF